MNDKETIRDMQKIMEYCCNVYDNKGNHIRNKCNTYDCEYFCETNNVCCSFSLKEATALYNAGYRKIPKGSVVLNRHEHQKYCAYKIIEPQIKGCLDRERELERKLKELEEQRDRQAHIAEELIQEKHKWTEQARKETAKEILSLAIKHDNGYETDMTRFIGDLKKQFRLGVEE